MHKFTRKNNLKKNKPDFGIGGTFPEPQVFPEPQIFPKDWTDVSQNIDWPWIKNA